VENVNGRAEVSTSKTEAVNGLLFFKRHLSSQSYKMGAQRKERLSVSKVRTCKRTDHMTFRTTQNLSKINTPDTISNPQANNVNSSKDKIPKKAIHNPPQTGV
jgi:hypothetical protein